MKKFAPTKNTLSLFAASIAVLVSSPSAFAAQGLNPQLQENGIIRWMNNMAGLLGPGWQLLTWGMGLAGFCSICLGIYFLIQRNDPQKRAQHGYGRIVTCFVAGMLGIGLPAFASQVVQTGFGSSYNSESVQTNSSNPFN